MANKALNQVSQVQSTELANVKTFLAVMNNGEIKQMSKEDMSAVVGGLLSSLKLYPFMYRGFISGDVLSSSNSDGYYTVNTSNSPCYNLPEGEYFGILTKITGDNNYTDVTFCSVTSKAVYKNTSGISGFGGWFKLN